MVGRHQWEVTQVGLGEGGGAQMAETHHLPPSEPYLETQHPIFTLEMPDPVLDWTGPGKGGADFFLPANLFGEKSLDR